MTDLNSGNPLTILVVDDNAVIRKLVCLTFNDERFYVLEADSGVAAVELIHKNKPDVIVLDVMMPGEMDGFSVCEFVRSSKAKYCWIILLTAKVQKQDVEKGLEVGADFYVTKPFSPLALLEIVEKIHASGGGYH